MTRSVEGLRVLIFGTEKPSVEWFKKSLIRCGALVSTIESPKKVFAFLKNSRMDLLIVDSHSHDVASLLIRAIRQDCTRSAHNIPAVVFTDDDSSEATASMLMAGFQALFPKPESLDQLVNIVEQFARNHGLHLSIPQGQIRSANDC